MSTEPRPGSHDEDAESSEPATTADGDTLNDADGTPKENPSG